MGRRKKILLCVGFQLGVSVTPSTVAVQHSIARAFAGASDDIAATVAPAADLY